MIAHSMSPSEQSRTTKDTKGTKGTNSSALLPFVFLVLFVVQNVRFPPTWTRVDPPTPCATATLNRMNAATNQTLPPAPRCNR